MDIIHFYLGQYGNNCITHPIGASMNLSDRKSRKSLSANPLRIIIDDRSHKVSRRRLCRLALSLYGMERINPLKQTILIFCSNTTIRRLNDRYRKIGRPTDVLSFTFSEPDLLGEIYISLPRAAQQAKEYGVSLDNEIQRLFVHGFFHLLGHDHKHLPDRLKMEKKELKYLRQNVFSTGFSINQGVLE
jgi:probable rRNA maturation factor